MTGPIPLRAFLDTSVKGGRLWVCRGKGKCAASNPELRKMKCDNCFLADPNQTIAEVMDRIEKGDA